MFSVMRPGCLNPGVFPVSFGIAVLNSIATMIMLIARLLLQSSKRERIFWESGQLWLSSVAV